MPGSGERATRREPSREAARRQAVDTLNIVSAIAGYTAVAVADGLSPEAARLAVVDAAAELELAASALRRLARPEPSADRRAVARELDALGWSRQDIAERLGVNLETARRYLRARPAHVSSGG